jgi:hypothetical protein
VGSIGPAQPFEGGVRGVGGVYIFEAEPVCMGLSNGPIDTAEENHTSKVRLKKSTQTRKQNPPKGNLTWPSNSKLAKLQAASNGPTGNKRSRKRQFLGRQPQQQTSTQSSDSIQSPDATSQEGETEMRVTSQMDARGIGLEVVLSGVERGLVDRIISSPMHVRSVRTATVGSGMEASNNEAGRSEQEVAEAKRVMEIQSDLGLVFHGKEGEDLQRSITFESRDRREKVEGEQPTTCQ